MNNLREFILAVPRQASTVEAQRSRLELCAAEALATVSPFYGTVYTERKPMPEEPPFFPSSEELRVAYLLMSQANRLIETVDEQVQSGAENDLIHWYWVNRSHAEWHERPWWRKKFFGLI